MGLWAWWWLTSCFYDDENERYMGFGGYCGSSGVAVSDAIAIIVKMVYLEHFHYGVVGTVLLLLKPLLNFL